MEEFSTVRAHSEGRRSSHYIGIDSRNTGPRLRWRGGGGGSSTLGKGYGIITGTAGGSRITLTAGTQLNKGYTIITGNAHGKAFVTGGYNSFIS